MHESLEVTILNRKLCVWHSLFFVPKRKTPFWSRCYLRKPFLLIIGLFLFGTEQGHRVWIKTKHIIWLPFTRQFVRRNLGSNSLLAFFRQWFKIGFHINQKVSSSKIIRTYEYAKLKYWCAEIGKKKCVFILPSTFFTAQQSKASKAVVWVNTVAGRARQRRKGRRGIEDEKRNGRGGESCRNLGPMLGRMASGTGDQMEGASFSIIGRLNTGEPWQSVFRNKSN